MAFFLAGFQFIFHLFNVGLLFLPILKASVLVLCNLSLRVQKYEQVKEGPLILTHQHLILVIFNEVS